MAADRSRSRPAWLPLVAATILVPTVLAGLTLLWPRPQIETELARTATEALTAAGFSGAGLTLAGRDATITGVPAADQQRAIAAVTAVTGIRVARIADAAAPGATQSGSTQPGATTPGATTPGGGAGSVQAQPFSVARRGADIVLTGVVGSADERAALVAAATAQAGGRTVVDSLTVTPGTPLPPGTDASAVGAATGALAALDAAGADLTVSFSTDGVALLGTVPDDGAAEAVRMAVSGALPGRDVTDRLEVATPPGTGGAGTGTAAELDATAKQQLQSGIDGVLAGAPISFGPDSAQLTPGGNAAVGRVLELVGRFPGARLRVDGFVATGPGNGRLTAQELSDQRAATVRDALVAGGVPADRIATRGLGEGPTPAAREAGRRVEITVV